MIFECVECGDTMDGRNLALDAKSTCWECALRVENQALRDEIEKARILLVAAEQGPEEE